MRRLLLLGLTMGSVAITFSARPAVARSVSLHPVAESTYIEEDISQNHAISLGLAFSSVAPLATPFTTAFKNGGSFRYAMPTSIALELGYHLSDAIEVGISAGYKNFQTRVDISGGSGLKAYQTVNLTSFPLLALVRYRFGGVKGWAPEVEGDAGFNFGTLDIVATDGSAQATHGSLNHIEVDGAAGFGFAWLEDISLHFALGYSLAMIGSLSYPSQVSQAAISGIFAKGLVRYQF